MFSNNDQETSDLAKNRKLFKKDYIAREKYQTPADDESVLC